MIALRHLPTLLNVDVDVDVDPTLCPVRVYLRMCSCLPATAGFSVEAGNRQIPSAVKTKEAACAGNEICLCVPIFFNKV